MNLRCTTRFSALRAIVACCLWLALAVVSSQAQAAPPITPSGLNTQVSGPISVGGQTHMTLPVAVARAEGESDFTVLGTSMLQTTISQTFLMTPVLPHPTSWVA